MHKHRSALVAVAAAVLKATDVAKDEMIQGPVPKGRPPGKRAHKREKNTLLLPEYDAVDMGLGMRQWAPTVLIRPGDANVSMEVTAENFQALFDIVQTQLAEPFTEGGVAGKHKLQRRKKTDPLAPKYSPNGTWWHISARGGWNRCIKEKTDVSGGSSSGHVKRRLVRFQDSSRAVQTKKARAAKTAHGRAGTRQKGRPTPDEVLAASDAESNSFQSRATSGSDEEQNVGARSTRGRSARGAAV